MTLPRLPPTLDHDDRLDTAHIALGQDLVMVITYRQPAPGGDGFTGSAEAVELTDSDGNHIGRLASFRDSAGAFAALPALVALARSFYPNNV